MSRHSMRFVPVKAADQQIVLKLVGVPPWSGRQAARREMCAAKSRQRQA
jgi:hypothetical protein